MYYFFKIKKRLAKHGEKVFFRTLREYHSFLSLFLGFKNEVNTLDYSKFPVNIKENVLKLPTLQLNKLRPTYVFVRRLDFHPIICINKMRDFKSLLKWNILDLSYPVVFRNYPLGFSARVRKFDKPKLALKLPPKVLSVEKEDIQIVNRIKVYEEIVTVMPYVKKKERKKLLKIPIKKEPLHKYHFSREQMKKFREKIAHQNNTSWINVQIFEIYDKFYPNMYVNVKQASGSKALECHLSPIAADKDYKQNYYLVIGQRRDNNQSIKAIVDPSDIKIPNNS